MTGPSIGEIVTIAGVVVVIVSLAGVLTEMPLPVDAQHLAWAGVAIVILGEAILVKG